jgi:putative Mg2+ transporter-C (MgtC) family protein
MHTSQLILRLGLATIITAVIGFEREIRGHPAGIRTHALVGLGSALFTIAGAYGFRNAGQADAPARVAAQVVVGIGFIGAGTILRHGSSVHGLTTAASLWLAAAIGVSIGAGLIALTLVAAAMVLVLLVLGHFTDRYFAARRRKDGTSPPPS